MSEKHPPESSFKPTGRIEIELSAPAKIELYGTELSGARSLKWVSVMVTAKQAQAILRKGRKA